METESESDCSKLTVSESKSDCLGDTKSDCLRGTESDYPGDTESDCVTETVCLHNKVRPKHIQF